MKFLELFFVARMPQSGDTFKCLSGPYTTFNEADYELDQICDDEANKDIHIIHVKVPAELIFVYS
jgi:hypothetical protein